MYTIPHMTSECLMSHDRHQLRGQLRADLEDLPRGYVGGERGQEDKPPSCGGVQREKSPGQLMEEVLTLTAWRKFTQQSLE